MRAAFKTGLFSALLLMSSARAAVGPDAPKPPHESAATLPAAEKASDVPDPEKLRRCSENLSRMRRVHKDVLVKLEEARASKDVVKLNCINEKLTQIKGLLRISEQADVSLQEAVSRRETATTEHEFTKVGIAHQRVDGLRAEAEECIGQLAFRMDNNLSVEVEAPVDLPGGDPTNPAVPAPITVQPPPASPTN